MKAGCDHFMHSKLVPAWGCRCCKSTSGLKRHNYWDVYSRTSDNGSDSQPKTDPKKENKDSDKNKKY